MVRENQIRCHKIIQSQIGSNMGRSVSNTLRYFFEGGTSKNAQTGLKSQP